MKDWKIGLVGLPNVGKSSLFKILTNKETLIANYPFSTIEPKIGSVEIHDERLIFLSSFFQSLRIISSNIKIVDIAGIVKGASQKIGLGGEFLSYIRSIDLICHVVRCFNDEEVIHVESQVDSVRDFSIIQLEFILADIEQVDNRIKKIILLLKKKNEKNLEKELHLMKKISLELKKEIPISQIEWINNEEKEIIKAYNFLTSKPFIVIANCDEENSNKNLINLRENNKKINIFPLSVKMENESKNFSDSEREEIGWNFFDRAAFFNEVKEALGLKVFFTAGKNESRSWLIESKATAIDCAGLIHSDIRNRFVRVEVYNFDEINNSKLVVRKENSFYVVKDGDICNFLFSR
jgi:ribosome-binding ATPase